MEAGRPGVKAPAAKVPVLPQRQTITILLRSKHSRGSRHDPDFQSIPR
jgi:hypothetical protein